MQFYIGLFSVFGSAAEHEVLFFSRGAALWYKFKVLLLLLFTCYETFVIEIVGKFFELVSEAERANDLT